MFNGTPDPVNPAAPARSTIARWLRRRGRALPPWQQISIRIVPPRCLFCGQGADLGAVDLCGECLDALPWLPPATAGPSPDGIMFTDVAILFRYVFPVDAALRALKFHGDLCPAQVFGALLAATAGRRRALPDLLVPVPLHPSRLHERGFNQAARLAAQAARWLGRPVAPRLLERRRVTVPQTSLAAPARRDNVAGAFAPAPGAADWLRRQPYASGHVALVDDVLTTGATAAAAATALQAFGFRRVSIWAVARPVSDSFTSGTGAG